MLEQLQDAYHSNKIIRWISGGAIANLDDLHASLDFLIEHPNIVSFLELCSSDFDDEVGVKVARIIEKSTTLTRVHLNNNNLTDQTLRAIAKALHVNTSLYALYLYDNPKMDYTIAQEVFVEALRANPNRPVDSYWFINSLSRTVYALYKTIAEQTQ